MNQEKITLGNLLGDSMDEEFINFDLTEIQQVLSKLQETDPVDIAHAELLQQQALRGADIISEYLGKMIKITSYLESKLNSTKNKTALEYKNPDGTKITADMRKMAGESSDEVDQLGTKLAKAKGSKSILEKKYDVLIRSHHHYKDIAAGLRKTVLGYNNQSNKEWA